VDHPLPQEEPVYESMTATKKRCSEEEEEEEAMPDRMIVSANGYS
jgi:hypothetical protein